MKVKPDSVVRVVNGKPITAEQNIKAMQARRAKIKSPLPFFEKMVQESEAALKSYHDAADMVIKAQKLDKKQKQALRDALAKPEPKPPVTRKGLIKLLSDDI